jgi:dihydroorotase
MNILIKQAKVVDKNSPFNGKKCDILIEQGTIQKISESIKASADKVIEGKDLHVSVGFFDFRANFQGSWSRI